VRDVSHADRGVLSRGRRTGTSSGRAASGTVRSLAVAAVGLGGAGDDGRGHADHADDMDRWLRARVNSDRMDCRLCAGGSTHDMDGGLCARGNSNDMDDELRAGGDAALDRVRAAAATRRTDRVHGRGAQYVVLPVRDNRVEPGGSSPRGCGARLLGLPSGGPLLELRGGEPGICCSGLVRGAEQRLRVVRYRRRLGDVLDAGRKLERSADAAAADRDGRADRVGVSAERPGARSGRQRDRDVVRSAGVDRPRLQSDGSHADG
jgi:hypothetical protein